MNVKLILLVGPPCSGKSSWSRQYLKENKNSIHICRDDLRMMLRGQMVNDQIVEDIIDETIYTMLESAIDKELDIIIDQTNGKMEYINNYYNRYKTDSDIELKIKVFQETPEVLFTRNIQRSRKMGMVPIPNAVMENMIITHRELLKNEEFKKLLEMVKLLLNCLLVNNIH